MIVNDSGHMMVGPSMLEFTLQQNTAGLHFTLQQIYSTHFALHTGYSMCKRHSGLQANVLVTCT